MERKRFYRFALAVSVLASFILKVLLIAKYRNLLTLSSDDLNYVKSAVMIIARGIFTYYDLTEPTVFVMPLYPYFLAGFFKVLGWGLVGLQAVRIIQAVLSCITIVLVYFSAKKLLSEPAALISAFLVSFYVPDIVTAGYFLTETLFTTLLALLIFLSLESASKPSRAKFLILGSVWAAATYCRPTIALYPVIFAPYLFFHHRMKVRKIMSYGLLMSISFFLLMSPWWVRNYLEYGKFIPLTASSGNPMLQGTYIDYRQTPENTVVYGTGKTELETDMTEVRIAKERILSGFKKDFWGYLRWYTIGKTFSLWKGPFYWKQFFGISYQSVLIFHFLILILGFSGIMALAFEDVFKYMLPVSVLLYFNVVHCLYMSFDRYAFPLMPLLSIFSAYTLQKAAICIKSFSMAMLKRS